MTSFSDFISDPIAHELEKIDETFYCREGRCRVIGYYNGEFQITKMISRPRSRRLNRKVIEFMKSRLIPMNIELKTRRRCCL